MLFLQECVVDIEEVCCLFVLFFGVERKDLVNYSFN